MTAGDQARVSVTVRTDPETAFRLFTEETDLWWQRGPRYRVAGRHPGTLMFEPKPGGRLMEIFDTPAGQQAHVTGTITVWDPPHRLQFDWRGGNFAPGERTEVEVTFVAVPSGTLVTVVHRGWAAIRPEHPARHGLETGAFIRMKGLWWADLMTALREHLEKRLC